jgi:A/G-specific adenine glycosylase
MRPPRRRAPSARPRASLAAAPAIGYEPAVTDFARLLAQALIPWFAEHARDLEWRRSRDPYAIWVSEIMLQQTRVDTVRAYYGDFLRRFPTVGALATADEDQVLAAWSGLGYYRRARLLHAGARWVARELGGALPTAAADLRAIPGVGRYTAGAIASIAFDRPEPLVDGNIARVLTRLLAITDIKRQGADAPDHWRVVAEILAAGPPRILAQALMELGATVCTPLAPRCLLCPARQLCGAHARGLVAELPAPRRRPASEEHQLWAVAIIAGDHLLLERRPPGGLLAGLWCLPLVPKTGENPSGPQLLRDALDLDLDLAEIVLTPTKKAVRHVFTHRIWALSPCRLDLPRRPALGPARERRWIPLGERPDGGVPRVTEKLLSALGLAVPAAARRSAASAPPAEQRRQQGEQPAARGGLP